jgi:hypothetical protein
MIRRFIICASVIALVATAAVAYGQTTPDRRGEVAVAKPEYKGIHANAPIPTELHIRNEGGSDGAGLCVISSILANGRYQRVPGLEGGKESVLWKTAKSRPGGYSPDKLARLLQEVMPDEKWASYVGRDTSMMEKFSSQGYPISMTKNTGHQYGYMPIHHMVSLIHYSKADGYGCVVDNNDPGVFHWMPIAEIDRRAFDGGVIWLQVWLRKVASGTLTVAVAFFAFVVILGSLLLLAATSAHNTEPSDFAHE